MEWFGLHGIADDRGGVVDGNVCALFVVVAYLKMILWWYVSRVNFSSSLGKMYRLAS